MKRFFLNFGLLIAAMLLPAAMYAQSNIIYFPYVINDTQTVTEIILTNVSRVDAVVSLNPHSEDGSTPASRTVTVPANAQVTVNAGANFRGWMAASTDAPGVLGNLRVSSLTGSSQDTTPSAEQGTSLILPLAAQSNGASTEIALVNTTDSRARVSMTAFDRDGKVVASADAALDAFGMLRGSIAAILGNDKNYAAASYIAARFQPGSILSGATEIPGLGFEIVRGFAQNDASSELISRRSDWAAFTATPVSSAASSFSFPQVMRDLDWFSLIEIVNASDISRTVTLTYSTAANPNAGTRAISLPGNGALRMTAIDLFGPGQDSGVVNVSASGNVVASIAIGTLSGAGIAAAPGQSSGHTEFFLPAVDETSSAFTGVALFNGNASAVSAEVFLISSQGETLGRATEVLPARQRVARELLEIIPDSFDTRGGFVFVRAAAPLFGILVSGAADKTLNSVSARATIPGYTPPPVKPSQGRLTITGVVRDFSTGAPAAGVTITLTRALSADTVTTTDANGAYAFNTLSNGSYIVTPTQPGRAFTPPSISLQLSGSNGVANFIRGTLPVLTTLTVITADSGPQSTAGNNPDAFAIFGTAEVTLRINGLNFDLGQTVFFGSRPIPSQNVNVVDSQTVFVRLILSSPDILAELAANGIYGRYNVSVAGQPPFNSTRSNALPFYILPPVPVLTSVEPPQTVARYEINSPGQQLTIRGFGFRSGARLLFDNGTALNGVEIDTTFVDSTQLRAFLPPQALRYGGIYLLRVRNVSALPETSGEAIEFQVNNLAPRIQSLTPPSPLEIIGPGSGPVLTNISINGSNFFPLTRAFITLKVPDTAPALIPVGGPEQCIVVNSVAALRVRVFNSSGSPQSGIPVTLTAPGINTNVASGAFNPGINNDSVTVSSGAGGFAPGLDQNEPLFLANPFAGSYVVTASANVGGILLQTAFNITNIKPGGPCLSDSGSGMIFVNSNQFVVAKFPFSSRGTYGVIVSNPAPGGGNSNEIEFEVANGPASGIPAIGFISPNTVRANSASFPLTVFRDDTTGAPFEANAWVNFGTVRLNRIPGNTDSGVMAVLVPGFLIASPGIVPITVTNPGNLDTGGTSPRVFLTVTP